MDGSAASILFMHAGGKFDNVHWIPAGHLEDYADDLLKRGRMSLVVDVAPNSPDLARAIAGSQQAFVIDHHASAARFDGLPNFRINVQNTACGSEMFRQWLVEQGMTKFDELPWKRFTSLIDDHDRWQLKQPMSLEMPRLFAFIGQKEFVGRFYEVEKRFKIYKETYWDEFELKMLQLLNKAQQDRFDYMIKNKFTQRTREWDGREIKIAYIVNGEINCSELLNKYLKVNPDVDLAVQINLDLNKVSLRSIGRVDITKFVAPWGGGGHKDAGGQAIPDGLTSYIIEAVHG